MASRKVIITCAITGSIHTPSMSPHLPITPDQVAKIRAIVEALGLEIATPAEARAMLATKGGDKVAF